METKKMSFGARIKESVRKFIVSLKHKPHMIPMAMMVVTFLFYSLNLTHVSNATAAINKTPMGLCGFVAMLMSMLSLVCFMNAFPNRKPVNKPMFILMLVMVAAVFISDVVYSLTIINAIRNAAGGIKLTLDKLNIVNQVLQDLWVHGILLLVSTAIVALLPVYAKLLRKINTSIEVEAGEDMAALELSAQD